ncbi:MAG TPA: protein kinase [Terriglobales bacterium]|nr:protein kinase [Terriglobales bacterium]
MEEKKPISAITSLPTEDLVTAAGGRYVFVCRIGAGGMGEVYRAEDARLKRTVAIKRLPIQKRDDERLRSRLQAEAERTSALNHPNVAIIYDVLEEKGEYLIVMEYVEGVTLRERLGRAFDLDEFFRIAVQCADGLAAAHEKGIVHCDIKPENIMLAPSGQVKLLDFGIARHIAMDVTATQTGMRAGIAGTPGYVPPEVILGEPASVRADIFALGVTFYEMLTGHHPFLTGNPLGAVQRILHDDPPAISKPPMRYPGGLEKIVARMLAKDAEKRYASAADLAKDLRAAQNDLVLQPAVRRRTRNAIVVTAAVVAVVAGAIFTPLYFNNRSSDTVSRIKQKHLAVLPFRAIGGKAEDQAYSEGLTETLSAKLTLLTAAHQLEVAAPSEVHGLGVDTPEKARRELGANLVIEGSLERSGDSLRVNYSLVDAATKRLVRSDTITVAASNPFQLEDQVVQGAIRMLELEIHDQEREHLGARGTEVGAAYDDYLKGLGYLANSDKPEAIDSAFDYFNRAIKLDREYAAAYAGLGQTYWQKYGATKDRQWVTPAHQNCQRSLELDPGLAAGHICLGEVLMGTGAYKDAAAEFDLATTYEPTSDDAFRDLARSYQLLGRLDEAERTLQKAIQVRPQYYAGYTRLGILYKQESRYPEAIAQFQKATELAPDRPSTWASLGGAYIAAGDYANAVTALQKAISIRPTWGAYSNLGLAQLYQRNYDAAIAAFEQGAVLGNRQYIVLGNLARAYYWAPGRRADAQDAYRRAIDAGEQDLKVNPNDADVHVLLANYHAMLGDRDDALSHLKVVMKANPQDAETQFQAAIVYDQLSDRARALTALEAAVAGGYSFTEISVAPEFDNLRDDPRYRALAARKDAPPKL